MEVRTFGGFCHRTACLIGFPLEPPIRQSAPPPNFPPQFLSVPTNQLWRVTGEGSEGLLITSLTDMTGWGRSNCSATHLLHKVEVKKFYIYSVQGVWMEGRKENVTEGKLIKFLCRTTADWNPKPLVKLLASIKVETEEEERSWFPHQHTR